MLGWHISVYRQSDGNRLAVWQTGLDGLHWIYALVRAGEAVSLGGNGYPCQFTAAAARIRPRILDGPPQARAVWAHDLGDILLDTWAGETRIDGDALAACLPDEELLIEAWDES